MRLKNSDCTVELTVVGYEYPAIRDDEWDSNWLQVRLDVRHPRGNWRSTDPSLSTVDLGAIANWLEAISRNTAVESPLEFVEPNLAFALIGDGDVRVVRVFFELESRPPWAPAFEVEEGSVYIDFPFDIAQIQGAIDSLRTQLERTPPRALRPSTGSGASEV